ncbi:MAG: FAD/NAD(P)-binding protein [Actinobacteria bacterium]|nr:FAD/NAD(P)-binding protein [Actinomycetota bacterium]MCG2790271.1 FAD/NAD(P)-binding protein [Actinomycetes bacterium]
MNNPYLPIPVTIKKITIENEARDIKTFDLVFNVKKDTEKFKYTCGQFAEMSMLGIGEAPIGIASSPMDEELVQFTVKKYTTGVVTSALHNLCPGDMIGIRGPYGNGFPMKDFEGSNLVIVGGGFALTTLRSLTRYILHEKNRDRFKDITILYGARSPGELIYKSELKQWEERGDINVQLTVDKGDENWKGRVGLVPNVLREVAPRSENGIVLVCGPLIMVKYTMLPILDLGFKPEKIFFSLEMRMKCGIGKCGRCNIGPKYVCKDGPVFTYKELQGLPQEY